MYRHEIKITARDVEALGEVTDRPVSREFVNDALHIEKTAIQMRVANVRADIIEKLLDIARIREARAIKGK